MNRPDISELLKQAQKMQEQMLATQGELASRTYEGQSGGGAVRVVVTGASRVESIHIDPAVIDPSDPDLLGDLVMVAFNNALAAAAAEANQAMGGLAGGLDLGGLGLDLDGLDLDGTVGT